MPKIDWYKSCAYNEPRKHFFHREARKRLKELAGALRLPRHAYDIRSNKGGVAVSGETTLHAGNIYVQVCQPATGADSGILIRTCQGRTDFAGGPNHFFPLSSLDDIERLAGECHRVLSRKGGQS
jgi:hypothetical protein